MLKVAALAVCIIIGVLFVAPLAVAELIRMRTRTRRRKPASTPRSQYTEASATAPHTP